MKKRTISTLVSLVFLVLFLGFLVLTASLTLSRKAAASSFYENRALAQKPAATVETLLDGTYFKELNTFAQDHTAGRNRALLLDTFLNLRVLRRPAVNDIVPRGDTLLPFISYRVAPLDWVEKYVREVEKILVGHARVTEAAGGRFYYVTVPNQNSYFADRYPDWLYSGADYPQEVKRRLYRYLDAAAVPWIDVETRFDQAGRPPSLFSKVDHHYTISGAYETYRAIVDRINADTGWDLPVIREGEYTIQELPNPFLGSRSRKYFGLWQTDEKLGLFFPDRPVPFTRTDIAPWLDGPTPNDRLDQLPKTDTEPVTYSTYMGGDCSMTEICTNRPELPSVLIYGDSFTNPVEGMLYTSFDTLWSLDLRTYDQMTLDQFIREKQPDIVLCMRDYDCLLSTEGNGQ